MKDLFEPVYSVDNWKEVIVDSERSIELLKQGYNPMGVSVGKWINKYETMRLTALQKSQELEQGLLVAASTQADEAEAHEVAKMEAPGNVVSRKVVSDEHNGVELKTQSEPDNDSKKESRAMGSRLKKAGEVVKNEDDRKARLIVANVARQKGRVGAPTVQRMRSLQALAKVQTRSHAFRVVHKVQTSCHVLSAGCALPQEGSIASLYLGIYREAARVVKTSSRYLINESYFSDNTMTDKFNEKDRRDTDADDEASSEECEKGTEEAPAKSTESIITLTESDSDGIEKAERSVSRDIRLAEKKTVPPLADEGHQKIVKKKRSLAKRIKNYNRLMDFQFKLTREFGMPKTELMIEEEERVRAVTGAKLDVRQVPGYPFCVPPPLLNAPPGFGYDSTLPEQQAMAERDGRAEARGGHAAYVNIMMSESAFQQGNDDEDTKRTFDEETSEDEKDIDTGSEEAAGEGYAEDDQGVSSDDSTLFEKRPEQEVTEAQGGGNQEEKATKTAQAEEAASASTVPTFRARLTKYRELDRNGNLVLVLRPKLNVIKE